MMMMVMIMIMITTMGIMMMMMMMMMMMRMYYDSGIGGGGRSGCKIFMDLNIVQVGRNLEDETIHSQKPWFLLYF